MAEIATLVEFLRGQGLTPHASLEPIQELAYAVHRARLESGASSTPQLTRTSCLLAIGKLDSEVRSQLKNGGLDWRKLRSVARLDKLPESSTVAEPLGLHPLLEGALARFAARRHKKKKTTDAVVGGVEVARAIVESAAESPSLGKLSKRLEDSGLGPSKAAGVLAAATPSSPQGAVDAFLGRALAITTISGTADEAAVAQLSAPEITWGVGPELELGDFVLMYVPGKLVSHLQGSRPGFYALYRVAAETEPADDPGAVWRHTVELTDRLALDPPISLDELRDDGVLGAWPLLWRSFRNAGRQEAPVAQAESVALWRLIESRFSDPSRLAAWIAAGPAPEPDLRGAAAIGDQPAAVDLLGRRDLVLALAAMLDNPAQGTPFTIALLGDWGSGKTTVMELLAGELERAERHEFLVARFNAWEYEHTGDLSAGLAQETVRALVKGHWPLAKWWLQIRFAWREHRWAFLRVALAFIVSAVSGIAYLVRGIWPDALPDSLTALLSMPFDLALSKPPAGGDEVAPATRAYEGSFGLLMAATAIWSWWRARRLWSHPLADELTAYLKLPDYAEHLGLIPVLRRHLGTLCELRGIRERPPPPPDEPQPRPEGEAPAPQGGARPPRRRQAAGHRVKLPRLVVFVDDLDRCGPQAIVATFDAMRLVMNLPEVVLIVGIDARIAFRAVGSHYAALADKTASAQEIARDFLGKIIQLPIRLGRPGELTEFIGALFGPSRGRRRPAAGIAPPERKQKAVAATVEPTASAAGQGPPEVEPGAIDPTEGADPAAEAARRQEQERPTLSAKLQREMEHEPGEVENFRELTRAFELHNPRKVLRLRNSYRLLKALDSLESYRDPKRPEHDRHLLMACLFWQEFLLELAPEPRGECEGWLADGNVPPNTKGPAAAIVRRFLELTSGHPGWRERLPELAPFVRRLVLPRGDVWAPAGR